VRHQRSSERSTSWSPRNWHILVPLDGSAHAERSLASVERLSTRCTARVTLLRVLSPESGGAAPPATDIVTGAVVDTPENLASEYRDALVYLNEIAAELRNQRLDVTTLVLRGRPAGVICDLASDEMDLVAMTSEARGALGRALFGSVAVAPNSPART
jgi:nucleotide-binding universal stress UspA family protein